MPSSRPPARRRWASTVVAVVGSFLIGALIGLLGTVLHRSAMPWGVVLALATVVSAGVLARAWGGYPGLLGYGIALIGIVQVLAMEGPGGDVLVPADQAVGIVWVAGSAVGLAVPAFAPRRWFASTPGRGSDRP